MVERDEVVERLCQRIQKMVNEGAIDRAALESEFPELADELSGYIRTIEALEMVGQQCVRHAVLPRPVQFEQSRQTLAGFTLLRELGRGGMGVVYEACQEGLSRRVALKVLPPYPVPSQEQISRFRREAAAAAQLHHSNIVPIFGAGHADGVHYCVMQLIDGASIDRIIPVVRRLLVKGEDSTCRWSDCHAMDEDAALLIRDAAQFLLKGKISLGGSLEWCAANEPVSDAPTATRRWAEVERTGRSSVVGSPCVLNTKTNSAWHNYVQNVVRIGICVADAVHHAHANGVLHRDIKPGNIMLDRAGRPWIAHFGLAKLQEDDGLTRSGSPLGTLRFTAPEQFRGQFDARSDVYSIGVTLFEMLALRHSFAGRSREELFTNIVNGKTAISLASLPIPDDLRTIVQKAMAVEPSQRYQTAAELAEDLYRLLTDRPIKARPIGWLGRTVRWCRRHRRETWMGAMVLTSLMAATFIGGFALWREATLRRRSDAAAELAGAALDRVFSSYLPDQEIAFTTLSHGSIGVRHEDAKLLEGLLDFYATLEAQTRWGAGLDATMRRVAACRKVGLISYRLGDPGKGAIYLGKALAILNQAKQQWPNNQEISFQIAVINNELGCIHWSSRGIREAHELHEAALKELHDLGIATERFDEMPPEYRFELCRTLYFLARRGRGRFGGTPLRPVISLKQAAFERTEREPNRDDFLQRAIRLTERLVQDRPDDSNARFLLALCYRECCTGRFDDAGEPLDPRFNQALSILRELCKNHPDNAGYAFELCRTLQWVDFSQLYSDAAYHRVAEMLQQSRQIAHQLAARRPNEWMYAAAEADAHILLARCLERRNAYPRALMHSESAIRLTGQLAERYPQYVAFSYWLAVGHMRRARILNKMGRFTEAADSLDATLQLFQQCLERQPEWQYVCLAYQERIYRQWAIALRALGAEAEAQRKEEQAALAVQQKDKLVATDGAGITAVADQVR